MWIFVLNLLIDIHEIFIGRYFFLLLCLLKVYFLIFKMFFLFLFFSQRQQKLLASYAIYFNFFCSFFLNFLDCRPGNLYAIPHFLKQRRSLLDFHQNFCYFFKKSSLMLLISDINFLFLSKYDADIIK